MVPIKATRRGFITGASASLLATPALSQDLGVNLLSSHSDADAPSINLPDDVDFTSQVTLTTGSSGKRHISMTFDDGPHPSLTPRLLDMLKQRNIVATFYVIGVMVRSYPDILRRIVDEGHEIGNHSYRHPNLANLSNSRLFEEIDRTSDAVDRVVKATPTTMRPPYGALTRRQRNLLHSSREMPTVLWSVDPSDWRRPGSSVVRDRILRGAHNGAIVLAHDIHRATIDAMPATLDRLISRGYEFKTVSDLVGLDHWGPKSSSPLDHIRIM